MLARSQGILCGIFYRQIVTGTKVSSSYQSPHWFSLLLSPVIRNGLALSSVIQCLASLYTHIIQTIVTVVFILTSQIGCCKVWCLIGLLYFVTAEQDVNNSPYQISLTDKFCILCFISDTCNTVIHCVWLAYVLSVYWVEGSDIWYRPSSDFHYWYIQRLSSASW